MKNPADDDNHECDCDDDDLGVTEDMLENHNWKLDMYRALLVRSLKGTDDKAMLLTAKNFVKKLDKDFYDEHFKHDLAEKLKQLD